MVKRGQVTFYIIAAIAVLLVLAYVNLASKDKASMSNEDFDISPIKLFANACVKKTAEEALFEKIGKQGGYIDPETEADQKGDAVRYEQVQNYKLPYHYTSGKESVPSIEEIKKRLESYVSEETKKCMDLSFYERRGFAIEKSQEAITSVDFNEEDTVISVSYPIKIGRGNSVMTINEFRASVPIRFKKAYDTGACFLSEIKRSSRSDLDVFLSQKRCSGMYSDEFMNIQYINGKYVLVYDYKTWYRNYGKTFKYRFAVDFT
ncbi:hypothetical protein HYU15_01690 [Candidatus Woesearchaeota archaeon]|nr:hypothetical protein [Candidatus Woesearchaeota archaeon]